MCKQTLKQILSCGCFFFSKSKSISLYGCCFFNDSVKVRQLNSVNHEIDCFAKILKNQTGP